MNEKPQEPKTPSVPPSPPLIERQKRISGKLVFLLCIVAVQLSAYIAGREWRGADQGRNAIAYAVEPLVGWEGSRQVQALFRFLVSPVSVAIVLVFIMIELRKKLRKM
jgi:hypothetical protein